MHIHCRIFFLFTLLAGTLAGGAEWRPRAAAAPEWDALFQRQYGWLGADGNYSVSMGKDRTLWLFSDTWVGEIKDGSRVNVRLINNSIALQSGNGTPEFFYRTNSNGEAEAMITPADGRGFFWLFGGVRTRAGLFLVLRQVETVDHTKVFGFRVVYSWMGHVRNPDAPPLQWKVEQRKMPCAIYTDKGALSFAAAMLRDGGYIYIYGNESRSDAGIQQGVRVARVRENHFGDFNQWRYYADGKWQKDFAASTTICPPAAAEYSVSYLPALKKYVLIHTEGLWGKIMMRTAPSPVGPWSEGVEVYRSPEMDWPGKIFCYAAKAHPQLAGRDELLITYAANSFDVGDVIRDARLYWPRFVRVTFAKE
jgi:hypothetical protein